MKTADGLSVRRAGLVEPRVEFRGPTTAVVVPAAAAGSVVIARTRRSAATAAVRSLAVRRPGTSTRLPIIVRVEGGTTDQACAAVRTQRRLARGPRRAEGGADTLLAARRHPEASGASGRPRGARSLPSKLCSSILVLVVDH